MDVRRNARQRRHCGPVRGRKGPPQKMTDTFRAFRAFDEDGRVQGRVVSMSLGELSAGDVVIRAAYSSVNYKDALAATGAGKIIRRFPLVPGIDVAGTVVSTSDARVKPGDA